MDASTLSLTINNQSSTSIISLTCPVGKISFQNEEFLSYKYLFETLDLDDDGRISFKEGNDLLSRSKVPRVS
jgi:Ca2+-binding EF-hand superfamily protein